jgi:cathepsin L
MRAVVALAVFLLIGSACGFTIQEYQNAFVSWMKEHQRVYTNEEFLYRYEIFKTNMDFVRDWNAQGTSTVVGLNNMADLSNSEYRNIYLGTRIDGTERLANAEPYTQVEPQATDIDWRTKGVVTPIKDQGQCGSCWAFSTTGSIEGATTLKSGKLVSVSEQNLMDCSTSYGNQGCNGGLMDNAFRYVIANKGIDTESAYPYEVRQGTCRFTVANVGASITGYKDITAGSEAALTTAIAQQPISVAIDASHNSFQLYKSGVYYEAACSSSRLDHGVLAIGYGTDDATGNAFYLVKNSWGTSWGTQGYIQMSRNRANNCGIATSASYPVA